MWLSGKLLTIEQSLDGSGPMAHRPLRVGHHDPAFALTLMMNFVDRVLACHTAPHRLHPFHAVMISLAVYPLKHKPTSWTIKAILPCQYGWILASSLEA